MFALCIYFFQNQSCAVTWCLVWLDLYHWLTLLRVCGQDSIQKAQVSLQMQVTVTRIALFLHIVLVLTAQHRAMDQSQFKTLQTQQSVDTSTGHSAQQYCFTSLAFLTMSCGYCIFTFAAKVFCWYHDRKKGFFFWRGKVNI